MKDKDHFILRGRKLLRSVGKYKYIFLVICVGILLLVLPDGTKETEVQQSAKIGIEEDFSVEALEQKLEETLGEIDGAGKVSVMLTVQSGTKRVLAQDGRMEQSEGETQRETETVVVSSGSGKQETVLIQQIYPQFQGALVVSSGGADPAVRLRLTEAISALTGLGADKISICKGK